MGGLRTIVLINLILPLVACGQSSDPNACRPETPGWLSMDEREITLVSVKGEQQMMVRVADDGAERAAGYQWICADSAEGSAVLFVFPQPFLAAFHMRNVFVPLTIAFFDERGALVDLLHMAPEPAGLNQPGNYYKAKSKFKYALELPEGDELNVMLNYSGLRLALL